MPRTKAVETLMMEETAYTILEQDHPLTLRNLYYTMLGMALPFAFPKGDKSYKKLARITADMRKNGELPYDWLEDGTREGVYWLSHDSIEQYINSLPAYYVDPWRNSDHYVEIWVESRSLAGIVRPTCSNYHVAMVPCGGRPSLSLTYECAQRIIRTCQDKQYHMLYIGDCDNDGLGIFDTVREHLEHHFYGEYFDRDYQWLAVTEQQISDYELITKPAGRPKGGHAVTLAAEAEAMPKNVLLALLSEAIEEYMPEGGLDTARAEQAEHRNRVDGYFRLVRQMQEQGVDPNTATERIFE